MQRMRPQVPPEPVQAHFTRRCPRPRYLEHITRHLQPNIRHHDLRRRNQLADLTPLLCRQFRSIPLLGIIPLEKLWHGFIRPIHQRRGSQQVRVVRPVRRQDIKLVRRLFRYRSRLPLASTQIRPRPRALPCVTSCCFQRRLRDAQIKVGKNQLDGREE